MATERGQRIEIFCAEGASSAFIDRARMVQVLGNLVENAVRYSPPSSLIRLGAERSGDELLFSVSDRGPGLPAGERELIFDKFYRSERTREAVSGTGLGLAIAKSLVELHHGRIWVEDGSPGSVFVVAVPSEAALEEVLA